MKDWTEAFIAAACVTIFIVWCTAIIAMYGVLKTFTQYAGSEDV